MKYIPYKDRKLFATDLKTVYGAVNEDEAYENLQGMRKNGGISILMQLTAEKKTEII